MSAEIDDMQQSSSSSSVSATAWASTFESTSAVFCPRCHSLMELPDIQNEMKCSICLFTQRSIGKNGVKNIFYIN